MSETLTGDEQRTDSLAKGVLNQSNRTEKYVPVGDDDVVRRLDEICRRDDEAEDNSAGEKQDRLNETNRKRAR